MSENFYFTFGARAPKFLTISKKFVNPIIAFGRALHPCKIEISMNHRAEEILGNIFSAEGTQSLNFGQIRKKGV